MAYTIYKNKVAVLCCKHTSQHDEAPCRASAATTSEKISFYDAVFTVLHKIHGFVFFSASLAAEEAQAATEDPAPPVKFWTV